MAEQALKKGILIEEDHDCRAVYRNFAKGGRIWGMEKRGGAETLCVQSTPSRGIRGPAPPEKFCDFLVLLASI